MMPTKPTRWLAAAWLALALCACGLGGPPQPLFTAKGVVLDADGQPVAGAVVSDGQVGVLTDEQGHYAIGLFAKHLQVKKPGFTVAELEADASIEASVSLDPSGEVPRVAFDTRGAGTHMDGFKAALETQEKISVVTYPATPLNRVDVLLMPTPGALSSTEISRLRTWLKEGGRLILCGEWGGYPDQNLDTLNALAKDAGIAFTGATVKLTGGDADGAEWMSLQGVFPQSLGKLAGEDALYLYTTTSLSLSAPAEPMLATDKRGYSVLARTGQQAIGAVGASGLGKVFAVGDSSLWLDEDSGDVGTPNWQRGGNLKFAGALIRW